MLVNMSTKSLRHITCLQLHLLRKTISRPTVHISHDAGRIHHLRSITSPAPGPTLVRIPPHRGSFLRARFTEADIPPLPFWVEHARPPLIPADDAASLSPEQYLEICQRYASLAIEDRAGWRQKNLTTSSSTTYKPGDGPIPLSTLHYITNILTRESRRAVNHITTHILHTGITLGYAPSILTMMRYAIMSNSTDKPQIADAREGLDKLASATPPKPHRARSSGGNNSSDNAYYRPDALTLKAVISLRLNTPAGTDRALHLFSEAAKAAAPGLPAVAWQYRGLAALEHSALLLQRKEKAAAKEILRGAAYDLDTPELCFRYAMLLDEGDSEREVLLQRAAVSGSEGAAREMGRIELRRAAEAKGKGRESERWDREVLAREWLAIAGDEVII